MDLVLLVEGDPLLFGVVGLAVVLGVLAFIFSPVYKGVGHAWYDKPRRCLVTGAASGIGAFWTL